MNLKIWCALNYGYRLYIIQITRTHTLHKWLCQIAERFSNDNLHVYSRKVSEWQSTCINNHVSPTKHCYFNTRTTTIHRAKMDDDDCADK